MDEKASNWQKSRFEERQKGRAGVKDLCNCLPPGDTDLRAEMTHALTAPCKFGSVQPGA